MSLLLVAFRLRLVTKDRYFLLRRQSLPNCRDRKGSRRYYYYYCYEIGYGSEF